MKRILLLILVIFLVSSFCVVSVTENTGKLNMNSTYTLYGKTLSILGAFKTGKIKIDVDGVQDILIPNKENHVNGMFITITNFTYIDRDYSDIILEVRVEYSCGDDTCEGTEDEISCCSDCNCSSGFECISNICQNHECESAEECDDGNECTLDECSSDTLKKCIHTVIDQCKSNDGCCPETCNSASDNDCNNTINESEIIVEYTPPGEEPEKEKTRMEQVMEESTSTTNSNKEEERNFFILVSVIFLVVIIGYAVFIKK